MQREPLVPVNSGECAEKVAGDEDSIELPFSSSRGSSREDDSTVKGVSVFSLFCISALHQQ